MLSQRSQKPRKPAQTERRAGEQVDCLIRNPLLVEKDQFALPPQRLQFEQRHQFDLPCHPAEEIAPRGRAAHIGQRTCARLCPCKDAKQRYVLPLVLKENTPTVRTRMSPERLDELLCNRWEGNAQHISIIPPSLHGYIDERHEKGEFICRRELSFFKQPLYVAQKVDLRRLRGDHCAHFRGDQ